MDAVVFDLDDTLCNWKEAQDSAIRMIDSYLGATGIDLMKFWADFRQINATLYPKFVSGAIGREEYRLQRFCDPLLLQGLDRPSLASQINQTFVEHANGSVKLFHYAAEALDLCRELELKIAVLTNGPSDGQRRKLTALGIAEQFDAIHISEETGVGKPAEKAFAAVCESLNALPHGVVMVGDSWGLDIAPAIAFGMHGFWISAETSRDKRSESGSLEHLLVYLRGLAA